MNEKLLANVRFYFAQSVFNCNCHFKSYERLSKRKNCISWILKSLSALTLFILILQVIGLENGLQRTLNVLSYIGMLITGAGLVSETLNKEDATYEIFYHKIYAEKYKSVRDEFMSLIEEVMSNNLSDVELRIKKNKLQSRYSTIGETAPETNREDYSKAQYDLGLVGNNGEAFTWSDEEIDKFLPEKLRLKHKNRKI